MTAPAASGITITESVDFGRPRAVPQSQTAAMAHGRVPRVARLMALAIHLEDLVASGSVRNYAEIACVGHVTRARVTQITSLLNLAPDIQEAILDLPPTMRGRDPITERMLRPIAAELDWSIQRSMWDELQASRV